MRFTDETPEEKERHYAEMNARAEMIMAEGGIWTTTNFSREIAVRPVQVFTNPATGLKSLIVEAVEGKPFRDRINGRRRASSITYRWPETVYRNENATADTMTLSETKTILEPASL